MTTKRSDPASAATPAVSGASTQSTGPANVHSQEIDRGALARITGAKVFGSAAVRWIPLFLPTLTAAFGVSTTQLTTVLGFGEFAGLSTAAVGPQLDRGRERTIMALGLGAIAVSSVIALAGSLTSFALSFVILALGLANFTVAGHAWISHRVSYSRRARSIGIFETSWALSLLLLGPVFAWLITTFGWRGPFVFMAVTCALGALMIAVTIPGSPPGNTTPAEETGVQTIGGVDVVQAPNQPSRGLTSKAWWLIGGNAGMATSGLAVFVISGSWLDESLGVSTAGLGFVVMGFGAAELVASTGTAAFADRIGKMRSTLAGVVLMLAGMGIMLVADGRLAVGVVGLLVFLIGYEYGFVTSFSLISEAMPDSRGSTLALGNAVATLARGTGVIISGWLFGKYGITGAIALSAAAALIAAGCLLFSRRAN